MRVIDGDLFLATPKPFQPTFFNSSRMTRRNVSSSIGRLNVSEVIAKRFIDHGFIALTGRIGAILKFLQHVVIISQPVC
jgi:hypothetical protein